MTLVMNANEATVNPTPGIHFRWLFETGAALNSTDSPA